MESKLEKMTYYSIVIFSIFSLTSLSLMSLHHILIAVPAFYFSIKFFKEGQFFVSKEHMALFFVIIFCALSILFNMDIISHPLKSLFKLKYMIIAFLGTFAYLSIDKKILNRENIQKLTNLFLYASIFATTSGIIGKLTGWHPVRWRVASEARASGMFGQAMSYGHSISIICSILVMAIVFRKQIKGFVNFKVLYTATFINLLGLYLSMTRGALIGFIVSIPFFFFFSHKKVFRCLLGLGVVLVLAVFYMTVNRVQLPFYRFGGHQSAYERIELAKVAIEMAKANPIKGVGYRNFEPQCLNYQKQALGYDSYCGHAHNNYMEMLGGSGIPAAIAFSLFVIFWIKSLMAGSILSNLFLPGVVNFSISGLSQSSFIDWDVMFILMFMFMFSNASNFSKKKALKLKEV